MRSVMLTDIKQYIANYTYTEYHGKFKSKELVYRNMWTDQGVGYWVKFVVALKNYFISYTSFYDAKYDGILISFLRALTHEDFNEVNLFLESAAKKHYEFSYTAMKKHPFTFSTSVAGEFPIDEIEELKGVIIMVSLASAFLLLLPSWRNARPGEIIYFKPFTTWFIDNFKEVDPFEGYLKTMLGHKPVSEIEKILGCQLSLVRWWNCPIKNVPSLESKFVTEPCPILDVSRLREAECLKMNFNLILNRYLMHESETNELTEMPFNLPSVLTFHYGTKIESLKREWQQESKMLIFKMFEHGFPPLLSPSYHRVEKSSLATAGKEFLSVLPCFAMNIETFDMTFLERMNEFKKNLCDPRKACNFNSFETFKNDSKEIIAVLDILSKNFGSYDVKSENNNNLKDFLFEPCILIQLVSQPVLLRQWFSAAFLAILNLQIETVEFRHLPIPKDIEPLIRRILLIISNLKEVMLFGFWYIGSFDEENELIHRVVDEYVFASLHDLEFICSNSAYLMVKTLKQKCYSERIRQIDLTVQLDPETYDSLSELASILSAYFFGNFTHWDLNDTGNQLELFPKFQLQDEIQDLPTLVDVNRYELCSPRPLKFRIHMRSSEEKTLFQIVSKCYRTNTSTFNYMSNSQYVATVVETYFAPCGHFSKSGCDKLVLLFSSMKGMMQGMTVLAGFTGSTTDPAAQAILSGVQYRHIVAYIQSIENETGLLTAMNRLSAEIAKKEQLVRIVAACTLILNEAPVLCQNAECPLSCCLPSDTSPMTIDTISKTLKIQKKKKKGKFCMKTFWDSNFPKEWTKPVNLNVVMPEFSDIPAVITALEERIGKLIWNIGVRHNKNIPGTVFFPDATIVHYILPCYISSLLEVDKLPNATVATTNNLISVLCALVKHYEESFNVWANRSKKLSNNCVDINAARYNYEVSNYALHGFARLDAVDGKHFDALPHLKLMLKSLNSCSEIFESKAESYISLSRSGKGLEWLYELKPALRLEHNVKAPTGQFLSRRIYTSHSVALRQVCFKTLPLSFHQTVLYPPFIQKMYFTTMLIHQVVTIIAAQKGCFDNDPFELEKLSKFCELFKGLMPELFYELFTYQQGANQTDVSIAEKWRGKKQSLQFFFYVLTSIRKNQNIKVQPSFPDFESPEFKKNIVSFFDGTLKTLKLFPENTSDDEIQFSQPTEVSETVAANGNCSAYIYPTPETMPITSKNLSPHSTEFKNVPEPTEIPETILNMKDTISEIVPVTNGISSDITEINAMPDKLAAAAVQNCATQQIGNNCTETTKTAVVTVTDKKETTTTNIKVSKKSSNTTPKPTVAQETLKVCNNCGKKEKVKASFIPCENCVEFKYPLTNFFCNTNCERTGWESGHMDQHLEHQLGLFDFYSLLKK